MCSTNQRAALKFVRRLTFKMRRTGYLGTSLLLLFALVVLSLPGFAQDKPKQAKTKPEYDAYIAFYSEKDPVKKAALGEKFIADFKESDYITDAYMGVITSYTAAKNWAKVIEAAEKAVALPGADNKLKGTAYINAMAAAQNMNDVEKTVSYGENVLTINPDDLNAMLTLSQVIPVKLPNDEAGKKAALDKAEGYANKALSGV